MNMTLSNSIGVWNLELIYKLLGVWGISIHPSLLELGLSPTHLPIVKILLSSHLNEVMLDLWSIRDAYHLVWWIRYFRYLYSENAGPAWSGETVSSYIVPPGVVQRQEIQMSSESHLVRKARWMVSSLLLSLTFSIYVTAKYYPPSYLNFIIKLYLYRIYYNLDFIYLDFS